MTPEQIEKHRKRFEDLRDYSKAYYERNAQGAYVLETMECMFFGYLLCAENMPEIHLPLLVFKYSTTPFYRKGYNQCRDDLKHRLESQGYTVKTL